MHQSRKHMTPIFHVGQVQSIQPGPPPQLTVIFSGGSTAISNISYLASYSPQVGDFCHAIHTGKPDVPGGADWLVIGAVAAGPKPIFSGYANTTQSIAAGATNTILVNTVQVDTANMLNPTNGTWSVPVSGVYRVSGIIEVTTITDAFAIINHSNVQAARGNRSLGQPYTTVSVVTALVVCAAGDYINIQAYSSASNTTGIDGSGQTNRMDIEQVG